MQLAWLAAGGAGASCSSEAGFERIESYGWFDRRPYRGGEDTVWIAGDPT